MHEELKGAGSSGYLASLVGGSVGKALRMLAEKAEYMAAAGPELRQVRATDVSTMPWHSGIHAASQSQCSSLQGNMKLPSGCTRPGAPSTVNGNLTSGDHKGNL